MKLLRTARPAQLTARHVYVGPQHALQAQACPSAAVHSSLYSGASRAGRGAQRERRSKSAREAGICQERKGAGVPGNQQIEAEAPELVQGIIGAQEGVCLRTCTWRSGRGSMQAVCELLEHEGPSQEVGRTKNANARSSVEVSWLGMACRA